jgi:hypothetical protein
MIHINNLTLSILFNRDQYPYIIFNSYKCSSATIHSNSPIVILFEVSKEFPYAAWHALMMDPKAVRTFGIYGPMLCPSKEISPPREPELK